MDYDRASFEASPSYLIDVLQVLWFESRSGLRLQGRDLGEKGMMHPSVVILEPDLTPYLILKSSRRSGPGHDLTAPYLPLHLSPPPTLDGSFDPEPRSTRLERALSANSFPLGLFTPVHSLFIRS